MVGKPPAVFRFHRFKVGTQVERTQIPMPFRISTCNRLAKVFYEGQGNIVKGRTTIIVIRLLPLCSDRLHDGVAAGRLCISLFLYTSFTKP